MNLPRLRSHSGDLEARRGDGLRDGGDWRRISEAGHNGIAFEAENGVAGEVDDIGYQVRLEGRE
jgi:hypothetical protein